MQKIGELGIWKTKVIGLTPFNSSLKSSAVKASKEPDGKTSNRPRRISSNAFS